MTTPNTCKTEGRQLVALGYDCVPVTPGTKGPKSTGWTQKDYNAQIAEGLWPASGVGVKAKRTPWIDVDVLDEELSAATYAMLLEVFGDDGVILRRVGRAPKFAIPTQADTPFVKQASRAFASAAGKECKIEILGDGQQCIAYAIHNKTGLPYAWPDGGLTDTHPEELPTMTAELAGEIIEKFETLAESMGCKVATPRHSTPKHKRPTLIVGESRPDNLIRPARVWSAMQAITPDLDHDDWVRAGMALFDGSGGHIEALNLWHRWSKPSSKYDAGVLNDKWPSFATDRDKRVRLPTLFLMARDAGWNGQYLLDEFTRSLIKLERERVVRDFDTRHGALLLGTTDFVVFREWDSVIGSWATRQSKVDSLKRHYSNQYLPEAIKDDNGNWSVILKDRLFDIWYASQSRRTYQRAELWPTATPRPDNARLPDGDTYNFFTGLAVVPRAGQCGLIIAHIREVWSQGDEATSEYVLNWLARMFQRPHLPGMTALSVSGDQGTGKTVIADIFVRAWGEHGMTTSRHDDVFGSWNARAAKSVFICLNEATWGGNRKSAGDLKALLTDHFNTAREKFVPNYAVRNCAHVIATSNEAWSVHVELGDRRMVMLETDSKYKGNRAYFKALADEIKSGGDAAFVHWLLERDITGFNPEDMPDTGAINSRKFDHIVQTEDSTLAWWVQSLIDEEIVWRDKDSAQCLTPQWPDGPCRVSKQMLYEAYVEWCKLNGMGQVTKTMLGRFLATSTPANGSRRTLDDSRTKAWELPPVPVCRPHLEKTAGLTIDWERQ